jgi:hypothetical protein
MFSHVPSIAASFDVLPLGKVAATMVDSQRGSARHFRKRTSPDLDAPSPAQPQR